MILFVFEGTKREPNLFATVEQLPDRDFDSYAIPLEDCSDFKRKTANFSFYKNLDAFICKAKELSSVSSERMKELQENWRLLMSQHLEKACYLCTGFHALPKNPTEIAQKFIFEQQLKKYIDAREYVAILCGFPLFVYEYMGRIPSPHPETEKQYGQGNDDQSEIT